MCCNVEPYSKLAKPTPKLTDEKGVITSQQKRTKLTSEGKAPMQLRKVGGKAKIIKNSRLNWSSPPVHDNRSCEYYSVCFLSVCDETLAHFAYFWSFFIDCGAVACAGKQNCANETQNKVPKKKKTAHNARGLTDKPKPTSIAAHSLHETENATFRSSFCTWSIMAVVSCGSIRALQRRTAQVNEFGA